MKAIETLFPVFFMIALALLCRVRGWVSPEQKEGTKKVVFNVLLPILIFHAIFTAELKISIIFIVGYVIAAFLIAYLIGKGMSRWIGERFARLSPFMLMTCEGGSVALPLYTSIVGTAYAINTVTFDIAGIITGFIIIPTMVARMVSENSDIRLLLKKTFTNSFVIAVIAGLIGNLAGVYRWMQGAGVVQIYTSTASMLTAPITGMILFTIGYDLRIEAHMVKPLVKLVFLRAAVSALIIGGFFLLFPELLSDKIYRIAVFIYYMCPTGFATPLQLIPLYRDEWDQNYLSAFLSLYMLTVTMIVYVLVVAFVA